MSVSTSKPAAIIPSARIAIRVMVIGTTLSLAGSTYANYVSAALERARNDVATKSSLYQQLMGDMRWWFITGALLHVLCLHVRYALGTNALAAPRFRGIYRLRAIPQALPTVIGTLSYGALAIAAAYMPSPGMYCSGLLVHYCLTAIYLNVQSTHLVADPREPAREVLRILAQWKLLTALEGVICLLAVATAAYTTADAHFLTIALVMLLLIAGIDILWMHNIYFPTMKDQHETAYKTYSLEEARLFYDEVANHYDKCLSDYVKAAHRRIGDDVALYVRQRRAIAKVPVRILDIGGGTGALYEKCSKIDGLEWTAMDFAERMIREFEKRNGGAKAIQKDITKLGEYLDDGQMQSGSYDIVLCAYALSSQSQQTKTVCYIAELLSDDGLLIIADAHPRHTLARPYFCVETNKGHELALCLEPVEMTRIAEALLGVGMKLISIKHIDRTSDINGNTENHSLIATFKREKELVVEPSGGVTSALPKAATEPKEEGVEEGASEVGSEA